MNISPGLWKSIELPLCPSIGYDAAGGKKKPGRRIAAFLIHLKEVEYGKPEIPGKELTSQAYP